MQNCPCGSSEKYSHCCGPFLEGLKAPAAPEELMRSRYTAFTKADTEYLEKTMKGKPLEGFDAKATKAWAESVTWLGLTVVKTRHPGKDLGTVEFIARFKENGTACAIHELSTFQKIQGRWFYVEGKHIE
ncbi:MAG: YchJ family metal-binding protein [Chlamydiae bacterium]|nr:YchJ family metal-binding protein [Chlamydiota bacterium]